MFRVSILGLNGRSLGLAVLAHHQGNEVQIWHAPGTKSTSSLSFPGNEVHAKGVIEGTFKMASITQDLREAILGSDLVMICIPLAEIVGMGKELVRWLHDGHALLVHAGEPMSAIILHHVLQLHAKEKTFFTGETGHVVIGSELLDDGTVNVKRVYRGVRYCFFPESSNIYVEHLVERVFPGLSPVDDIRETSLLSVDTLIAPTLELFRINTSSQDEDILAVSRLIETMDRERCYIANKMGMQGKSQPEYLSELDGGKFHDHVSLVTRYIEDGVIPASNQDRRKRARVGMVGLAVLRRMGSVLGVPVPTIDSVYHVFKVALQFRETDNMPVPEEKLDEMISLLIGKYTSKRTSVDKINFDVLIDKICNLVLVDLMNDWLLIQADRKTVKLVMEHLHDSTGKPITPNTWKQYFSSEKHSQVIAVLKKSQDVKEAFKMGGEFEEFHGMKIQEKAGKITVEPLLFSKDVKAEAKERVARLKEELKGILSKITGAGATDGEEEENEKRAVIVKDIDVSGHQEDE